MNELAWVLLFAAAVGIVWRCITIRQRIDAAEEIVDMVLRVDYPLSREAIRKAAEVYRARYRKGN